MRHPWANYTHGCGIRSGFLKSHAKGFKCGERVESTESAERAGMVNHSLFSLLSLPSNRSHTYGLGGEVQIRISSVSFPVFSMPCWHQGGRWMNVPALTGTFLPARVIVPSPLIMT